MELPLSITKLCWCLHAASLVHIYSVLFHRQGTCFHAACGFYSAGLSHRFSARSCMATGGEGVGWGGEGGSHGPTCPPHRRPSAFLSASPSFCFRIPQVRIHTHTRAPSSIERYAPAPETRIRDARSPISISLMISLQARIDHLCRGPIGAIHFNRSDVNVASVSAERL